MIDINPTDLRYFFEVARSLNISRAAERLDVGQPTVSQAIQRIERLLGVALFDRFKTGVQLTQPGRRLFNDGQKALEVWENLKVVSQSSKTSVEGRYTIGCHTAVATYSLPKFLRHLLAEHSNLEIELKHGLSREIVADVIAFKTDFGLVMNPIRHPDLVIKHLCEDRVSFWKAANSIEDTLIFDPALSQSQSLFSKIGKSLDIKRHLTSGNLELIARLTSQGCGIGVIPERIAVQYSNLVPVSKSLPSALDRLALVYRGDRSLTQSSRVIVDSILRAKF
jgi:DNA-binding transcriptional LysR family regulator